ncbi:hypothetical protein TIFTF001_029911 [Ficus carica]|uniref:Uncharacterized protein n=1 Tax=Ficus carica TaxID=3494 RepID=A0AA88J309_FICCA|nr:hypothetical protein TIFTF001_029911 [Ficus carica]
MQRSDVRHQRKIVYRTSKSISSPRPGKENVSGGDLDLLARCHQISSARAQSKLRTSAKAKARGFGSGSGKKEPSVVGSLMRGRDWRYEVTIGTLEAGEGGGTSWLGIGKNINFGG